MMNFIKNYEILLQLIVSFARPILFTYAVITLKTDISHSGLMKFIGYVGLFSIPAAITQSYARVSTIYSSTPSLTKVILLALTFSAAIVFYIPYTLLDKASGVIAAVFILYSLLQLFEQRTSQKDFVRIASGFEISLIVVVLAGLRSGWHKDNLLFTVLPFISFPISILVGLVTVYLFRPKDNHSIILLSSSQSANNLKTSGAWKYIASSVTLQLVCACSATAAAIYNSIFPNYDVYIKSLILLRWVFTLGSLGSFLINIFGSRIFFRTINVSLFSNFAKFLVFEVRALWSFAVLGPLSLLVILVFFSEQSLWLPVAICTTIVGLMNFFSSLLLSFAKPTLALTCQVTVAFISFFIVAICYKHTFVALMLLGLIFISLLLIIKPLIRTCSALS